MNGTCRWERVHSSHVLHGLFVTTFSQGNGGCGVSVASEKGALISVHRKCECQANSSAQLLFLPSTGTINSKHGGRGRDGVQGSYRLWLQIS